MRFVFACAGALTLVGAVRAAAHAPPEAIQLVSTAAREVLLSTNRGLIWGDLQTREWSLLCNEALAAEGATEYIGTTQAYRSALLPSGRLFVASSNGLLSSDDRGCSFNEVPPLTGLAVRDIAVLAGSERIYVVTEGAGEGALRVSDDRGQTWSTLLTLPDSEYVTSLRLAGSMPLRIYMALWSFGVEADSYALLRSSDGGVSWERSPVALTSDERDLTLLAVNPSDADELLARASGAYPERGERALLSRDGGRSFQPIATIKQLRAGLFSASGQEAYLAGRDGLYRADAPARLPLLLPETARMTALAMLDDGQLLAAGYYAGLDAHDGVGVLKPGVLALEPWMTFSEVQAPLRCPAPSRAEAVCSAPFEDWRAEQPAPSVPDDAGMLAADAGVAAAGDALDGSAGPSRSQPDGSPASPAPPASPASRAGCAVSSAAPGTDALAFLSVVALVSCVWLRRRNS